MAIEVGDLKIYGSDVMPEDDVTTEIGGDIDLEKKPWFVDTGVDALQAVSSSGSDTTQDIDVTYRDVSGAIQTLQISLNGTTVVTNGTAISRILKAVKSGTCAGRVALEGQTAVRTGTAQGGGANYIDLDAGASAVDNFYRGMVVRITSGTGSGQIAQIVKYDGPAKRATINEAWPSMNPNGTSVFRVSKGCFFDKAPDEIMEVRRVFYNAAANVPGGGAKDIFELVYMKNAHASLTLTEAQVLESADPSGKFTFGVGDAINTAYDNGMGNDRTVAPDGVTFDNDPKAVPGDELEDGDYIAVWLKYSMADGDAARETTYTPALQGVTT